MDPVAYTLFFDLWIDPEEVEETEALAWEMCDRLTRHAESFPGVEVDASWVERMDEDMDG